MMNLNRHLEVFSPDKFGKRRIDIIGAGSTGSKIALDLAKLGIENLHVWDYDKVESHNIPNQLYGIEHINMLKVDALKSIILKQTDIEITIHNKKVIDEERFGDVIFLLVDSMKTRKEIWDSSIKYQANVKVMIETRMGSDQGRIYIVNPLDSTEVDRWEKTLYGDDESEVSACGTSITVGPTSTSISGFAVWQFLNWYKKNIEKKDIVLSNELIFTLSPTITIYTNSFHTK